MLAFWAGTVPLLALFGVGIASLGGARRQLLTALAGLAMVAVGVHTAAMRASLAVPVAERLAHESSEVPAAHASIEHPARPACCAAEAGQ
jgi:sulfite exporter TauE/SafE